MALAAVCRAPGRRAHARGDQGTRGKASASHKAESQLAPSRPDRPGLRVTRHGDHRRDKHDDTLRTLRHPHRLRLGDSDGGIGATGPGTGQPTSAHSGGSTGNPGYVPPKSRQEICCSRPGLLSPEITPINTARPAPATPTKRSCFGFNARFSAPTLPPRENGRRRSSSLPWVGFQDVRRPLSSVVRCLPWRP
jgi:hypothetical protein